MGARSAKGGGRKSTSVMQAASKLPATNTTEQGQ